MNTIDKATINFDKLNGLIPVCIQDYESLHVLMIGFMNEKALQQTLETNRVTFYSRSKQRLWTKGERSGNFLVVQSIALDCDKDSLLILAKPEGPTCHLGSVSCFKMNDLSASLWYWLACLNQTITTRQHAGLESYTKQLLTAGMPRIAQKVGEEGVEVAIAAVSASILETANEVVDLFYHLFVLILAKEIPLHTIAELIQKRSQP